MHAVYFFSPGKPNGSIVEKYEQALAPLGDFELIWAAPPGFSSVFQRMIARLRRKGDLIPALLEQYPPSRKPTTISLIGYSAGCWFMRDGLTSPHDRAMVDAVVMLDGLHGTKAQLKHIAKYAKLAKEGEALLAVGHSDVKEYGYPSTSQSAATLLEMTGGEAGSFDVVPYDVRIDDKAEHGAALSEWGPAFVGAALCDHLQGLAAMRGPAERPKWLNPELTLGERAVEWCLAQIVRGNIETLGANAGPLIAEYHRPGLRRGTEKPVGIRSGSWCASSQCYADRQCMLEGEEPVLPYRVASIELMRDAEDLGILRKPSEVLDGSYTPKRGDLVGFKRAGESWMQHVARVTSSPTTDGTIGTVDGNYGNRWATRTRKISEAIWFIEYPRRGKLSPLKWQGDQCVPMSTIEPCANNCASSNLLS